MALDNTQERVEKSIYEAIRLALVANGYLPDITSVSYPNTQAGETQWTTDLQAIVNAKQFAIEVFGHGSSNAKEIKRTPRIAIIPRRIMPGDIGMDIRGGFSPNPLDPDSTVKIKPTLQAANFHIDINIVSGTSAQDRVLHAILAKALSIWSFIPMYDDPQNLFFIRQFNFYDIPDTKNGIEEKVYSYEVPDLYLYEGDISNVALIKEITINTNAQELQAILKRDGAIIGPFKAKDVIYIDLSGIKFKVPVPETPILTEDGDNLTTEGGQNIIL